MTKRVANTDCAPCVVGKESFIGSNLKGERFEKSKLVRGKPVVELAGYVLTSYATPIAVFYRDNWYVTDQSHSKSTAKQRGQALRSTFGVREVDQEIIDAMAYEVSQHDKA